MTRPYVGLRPYRADEKKLFFGRAADLRVLNNLVATLPSVVVYATSGTGKSSLLNAGLMAQLDGDDEADGVYISDPAVDIGAETSRLLGGFDPGPRELDAIFAAHRKRTGRRVVLIVDQFEERLKAGTDLERLWDDLAPLANGTGNDGCLVMGIRDDYVAALDGLLARVPGLLDSSFRVPDLSESGFRDAVRKPLQVVGSDISVDDELIDRILADLREEMRSAEGRSSHVEPGYFQLVCDHLWNEAIESGRSSLSLEAYEAAGRSSGIIDEFVRRKITGLLPFEREMLYAVVRYLILPTGAKVALTTEDLIGLLRRSDLTIVGALMPMAAEVSEKGIPLQTTSTKALLDSLFDSMTTSESPVFRRVRRGQRTEFELVHDLLGSVLLAWRTEFEAEQSRRAASWTAAIERHALPSGSRRPAEALALAAQTIDALPPAPPLLDRVDSSAEAGALALQLPERTDWLYSAASALGRASALVQEAGPPPEPGTDMADRLRPLLVRLDELRKTLSKLTTQTGRVAAATLGPNAHDDDRSLQREAQEAYLRLPVLAPVLRNRTHPLGYTSFSTDWRRTARRVIPCGIVLLLVSAATVFGFAVLVDGAIELPRIHYLGLTLCIAVIFETLLIFVGVEGVAYEDVTWERVRSGVVLVPPIWSLEERRSPEAKAKAQRFLRARWVGALWLTPAVVTLGLAYLGAWIFDELGVAATAGFNLIALIAGLAAGTTYSWCWEPANLPDRGRRSPDSVRDAAPSPSLDRPDRPR